jgi:hypothetical protein
MLRSDQQTGPPRTRLATQEGQIVGTPAFMSPDCYQRQLARAVKELPPCRCESRRSAGDRLRQRKAFAVS